MSLSGDRALALMEGAVAHSSAHVESGGLPFVGLIANEGGFTSGYGVNLVPVTGDATAHAEIVAMREALATLDRDELSGTTLLATGEPCGLCYQFARQHGVDRVYVAVDRDTVAEWGIDYRDSYPAMRIGPGELAGWAVPLPVPNGLEPFEKFLRRNESGPYAPLRRAPSRKGSS